MTQRRPLLPYFLLPALPLLVPLIAMRFTTEVNWSAFDFVVAYFLFTGAGLAYRLATSHATRLVARAAAALGVFAGLSLIWVNLAVGFIGNEDNPANLLYLSVIATGVLGSIVARLEPRGMARVMGACAAVQFAVPVIAWLGWRPNFDANVALIFFLNSVWVLMFAASALLFRQAAGQAPAART